MKNIIFALILLLLALGGIVLRKTYFQLPVRELKRRAEHQDAAARTLYRSVAYGNSLRGLLWLFIGLTAAGGVVLLARELNVWVSLLIIALLLWLAFSLVPSSRTTKFGIWLTVMATPPIAWLLNYLHPLLSRGGDVVERRYTAPAHTRLFERDDLIRLIERQHEQDDSRFTREELEIAIRALSFEDYLVADVMTPRKKIKTILADDPIGPVLINELHESGQEQILVRESAKGPFIGSLRFGQLGLHSKGHVRDIMQPVIYYVHENDSLGEALHAFFTTNHPIFVAVNSSEEYVGIVTIEDVVRQLVGHLPGDDFDQYTDLAAVAARHPRVKKPARSEETPVKTDEEVVK